MKYWRYSMSVCLESANMTTFLPSRLFTTEGKGSKREKFELPDEKSKQCLPIFIFGCSYFVVES